ncbi:MAG TPA: hypothetical protein VK905_04715 [Bacillota bacterium]|nr:hypothetical protein [Bacillota bacterium]
MNFSLGVTLAAIMAIAVYSYLWRENTLYRIAEHLFVGLGAGYSIAMGWNNIKNNALNPLMNDGKYILIVPLILGALLFTRFLPGSNKWLARIPMAFLVGTGIALSARAAVLTEFVNQIRATIIPLNSVNNILIVFGTIGVLAYFFFSNKFTEGIPGLKYGALVGRYVMMAAFGAAFGNGVMGRISLLISQLQFIFGKWLGLL